VIRSDQQEPGASASGATTDPASVERIVFFDGVCHLCSSAVRFIIKNDPEGHFRFAALQSETGESAMHDHGIPNDLSSIALVESDRDGPAALRSTAALRIARRLRFPWPLCYVFIVVPRVLRDPVYNWIARNRYKWFGKSEMCMMPDPAVTDRFL